MIDSTIQLPFPAADPYILRANDGRYYLYCTKEDGRSFPVYSSDDLITWQEHDPAFREESARWGSKCFWAPECYQIEGRYYLFYSADWKENPSGALENFRIGVAVADTPLGPFTDMRDQPIFDPGYPVIDANVYHENGRFYLYYSRCCYEHCVDGLEESWIYGVELKPDFSEIIGKPTLLLRPEQEWEGRSVPATGRRWNEGSYLFRINGKYVMTYSGNYFGGPDYAVGYAVADDPLGPYVKAQENPILERHGFITGTGHSCMVNGTNREMLICYHGRTESTGNERIGFISPVEIIDTDRLKIRQDENVRRGLLHRLKGE